MTVKPTKPTKETKKGYFYSYEGDDSVNLSDIELKKKKPLNVTLNNTSGSYRYFDSSYNYDETITVASGHYTMSLDGCNSNKTVKLGNTEGNNVHIKNLGKNKITTGDGGNNFYVSSQYSDNTITAGKGKDYYVLSSGKTKITDKGGKSTYTINGGRNTITEKGGINTYTIRGGINKITDTSSDESTFTFYLVGESEGGSEGGITTIKSGAGVEKLYIHNDFIPDSNELIINADLGAGNDIVEVDFKEGATYKQNASVLDVKTGKGEDTVYIYAGKKNTVDTGKDNDTVRIYGGKTNFVSTGDGEDDISVSNDNEITTISTIKAGKGADEINTHVGTNIIYGESGVDKITLWGGTNTVYGGGDEITTKYGSSNTIYASADNINLSGGTSTIYVKKGKNEIYANGGTNEIHLAKGKNTIVLTNGNNIVYGSGKETIKTNGTSGTNTIYTYGDTVNLYSGTNEIHTLKGNSTINVLSAETFTANDDNVIYLDKGNNTVNLKGGRESDYTYVDITISGGKNTINLDEYTTLDLHSPSTLNTTQKINIQGHAYAHLNLGDGADIIKDSSDAEVVSGWEMRGAGGNDKYYVSNGSKKTMKGGNGNDYFEIISGSQYQVYGNNDNDTFTITGGNSHKIYGGDGSDTFNIKGGKFIYIYGDWNTGENGDDIYNLKTKTEGDFVIVSDTAGNNKINVSKNYKCYSDFSGSNDAKFSLNFDKSYKLTSGGNVKNNIVKTNDSNITMYMNFKNDGNKDFDPTWGYEFIVNAQNEISDNDLLDRVVNTSKNSLTSVNVGGTNYTLDLNQLKSDLVTWFSDASHSSYADSETVFYGSNEADKQSLMAVYTKDTAGCFVKA